MPVLPSRPRLVRLALPTLAVLALGGLAVPAVASDGGGTIGSGTRATAQQAGTLQLVRVQTPTRADRDRLVALGLDLTEHGGPTFVDVVLHGRADLARLGGSGLRWTVLDRDLRATERERAAADQQFAASTTSSTLPSGRTSYRTLADYESELRTLSQTYPATTKLITLAHPSLEGRTVYGLEVTHNAAAQDGKPVMAMFGLHHAREWPSGELTMEFAYDLLKNDGVDARITGLLDRVRLVFVPVVNPDGFRLSREVANHEYKRKNCRVVDGQLAPPPTCANAPSNAGTDPNRNYGGLWGGPGASTLGSDETYRGAGPFSEPETRNVQDLVSTRQVVTLITNHTYSNLVLRPPGVQVQGTTPDEPVYKSLGDQMAAQSGYTSQYGYQLYDTTGTTEDWTYWTTGGLGYTFEIGRSSFHPRFSDLTGFYFGSGRFAGKGNREAWLIATESTANTARHAVITGTAPAGATLRIRKQVDTATWNGSTFPDVLTSVLAVPATGSYTWSVNPSTRPITVKNSPGTKESWTLTCERDGTVRQTEQVVVDRGQQVTLNLTC